MRQIYIIFAKNLPIEIFVDEKLNDSIHIEYDERSFILEMDRKAKEKVVGLVGQLEHGHFPYLHLYSDDPEKVFDWVASYYDEVIEAAGGVVINEDDELLVIYRLGKWDLPKGKIEIGEKPDNAALREVLEETGLKDLELKQHLTNTYHTYELKGKHILKRTYWYLMSGTKGKLTPQTEENIEMVEWLPKSGLEKVLDNTYENIKLVLKDF